MNKSKIILLLLTIILSLHISAQKSTMQKIYAYGFSASFTDSVAYFTEIQEIDSAWIDIDDVKLDVINELLQEETLLYVVDCAKAGTATVPELIRERIINGYNRLRSGDIVAIPRAQMFSWQFKDDYIGTTHSQWNPYDAHIPLVFFGWHVAHGSTSTPTRIVDIAATVCAMLHIEMPNSCIGNAILPVVGK